MIGKNNGSIIHKTDEKKIWTKVVSSESSGIFCVNETKDRFAGGAEI